MTDYNSELDKKAETLFQVVDELKTNFKFSPSEDNLLAEWINELKKRGETQEEKVTRNEYLDNLVKFLRDDKELKQPFNLKPPSDGPLEPFYYFDPEKVQSKKLSYTLKKIPSPKKKSIAGGVKPKKKEKPLIKPQKNLFEDPIEIARVIAKSKGLSFADFVVSVAKYTEDYGEALRSAMRIEVTEFRDYVNKVIDQRIKDMRKIMDEECNYESEKINKDIEKWKNELSNVKREITDMIPDFDIDDFKSDRHYLTKVFSPDLGGSKKGGSFNNWMEESCMRLKWYNENINKLSDCNQQLQEEISCMKEQATDLQHDETLKQQSHSVFINTESRACLKLNKEIECLNKELAEIQTQLTALQKC